MATEVRSSRILTTFFALLVAGIVAWVLVLLAIWRVPITTLATPERLPETALTVYMVGLYLWLMTLVGVVWRKIARRSWSEMGLRPSWRLFARGLLFGVGMLAIIMGVESLLGWARFVPPAAWPLGIVLGSLGAALAFAISEEVLFRGFFLRTLALSLSPARAILISALIYASLHFLRTNLTVADLVLFLVLAGIGIVLAIATLRTGTIWLSVGLHFSWIAFFSLSQQLKLWSWADTGLPLVGGSSIGLLALPLLIPLAFMVNRRHG